jgi:hypothetical protein
VRPIQHGERERERKRSSPRGGEGSLLNRRRRKWGGRGGSRWACPRGGWRTSERRGALARWSVARGSRQWPPTVGHGWRRCRVNRGGRRAWAMRVADARDWGEVGPGVSGGVWERAKRREAGGGGALTRGPGRHSAGRRGSNSL